MGSCAAPSAKGDDKFITTDYLQQCPILRVICGKGYLYVTISFSHWRDYKRYYVLVFLPQQPQ
ncbi:hypothetical protein GXV23_005729 [Escherichia coli]|nr:hypothetical protein [Escherichia coli]